MNYLAHAYLSFNDPDILAGNMISDFVKGKKQYDFPIGVQKGIRLHRAIDQFTDSHLLIKEMKKVFQPHYGLYAGAFNDIACDYFLANDRTLFESQQTLDTFTSNVYAHLYNQHEVLPETFQRFLFYMKQGNWLYNYQFEWGIQKSFEGMVHRAVYLQDSETAFNVFVNNIDHLQPLYNTFFPLLKQYCVELIKEL